VPDLKHQDGGAFDVKATNEAFKPGPIDPVQGGDFKVFLVNVDPKVVVQYVKVNRGNWMRVEPPIPQTCPEQDKCKWHECWKESSNSRFLCGVHASESNQIYIAYKMEGKDPQVAPLATPLLPVTDNDDAMTYIPKT